MLTARYIKKINECGDLSTWIVDGSHVRTHIDEEFTNLGQHQRDRHG